MKRKIQSPVMSVIVVLGLLLSGLPVSAAGPVYVHGNINGTETWLASNLYIVDGNLTVTTPGQLTIEAGTQIKVEPGYSFTVNGSLLLPTTSGAQVVFTSNRDNSVGGDTDPSDIPPAPADWKGISLIYQSSPGSPSFEYTTVRYATTGLALENLTAAPINPTIAHNTFEYSQTGVNIAASSGDLGPTMVIQNNYFFQNTLGLEAQSTSLGNVFVQLKNNLFEQNSSYPVLLRGGTFPSFSGNTFTANGRQGIGVVDVIDIGGAWNKVPASSAPGALVLPYLVDDYLEIAQGTTLQISDGLVVKFGTDGLMEVYGELARDASPTAPVVFTSIHDDTYGGDTDGQVIDPASDPWAGLELFAGGGLNTADFSRTIFRYASSGLMITNGSNAEYSPAIHDNTFAYNGIGVNMLVGMAGDVKPLVSNNSFSGNQYGLVAVANSNVAGHALPSVQSNQFLNNADYPLMLQGSVFPSYSGNTFSGNLHPAIGVQGKIRRDGAWTTVMGQAGINLPYVLTANYEVSKGQTLTVPAGTVVKSAGPGLNVFGTLNLQGTSANPVVFTSLKDDDFGGNADAIAPVLTNSPAAAAQVAKTPGRTSLNEPGFLPDNVYWAQPEATETVPNLGDWTGLVVYAGGANIHDARVRYATFGVRLLNTGSAAISVTVQNSILDHNLAGIGMEARYLNADINALITGNQIVQNKAGVKVSWDSAYQAVSTPLIHNNNIMVNGIGVENLSPVVVDATNNWWGDASGPRHSSNPGGRGDPVSNNVNFNPYLGAPPFPPSAQYFKAFLPVVNK
jgi:hypothetical protein